MRVEMSMNGIVGQDIGLRPHFFPHFFHFFFPFFLALDRNGTDRQAAYRALFRSELEEEALADIRLALSQGQPLGHGYFSDRICAAAGVRRTQKRPGRPTGKTDQPSDTETQIDFGF